MQINFFEKLIGSGFYTGYMPLTSGTFGSLVALLIYWIPGFENPSIIIPCVVLFASYGIYIGGKFEKAYGKDPAECTVDEIVGQWISLLFLPKTILISLFAFFVWRLFDIVKPFPARRLEKLPGGFGIMMDDVAAGFYSLILVHIILFIFNIV
ncbi:MAG: phosphatidylglycerophosphatase A [Ignavibacteria bacterium RBG_16_34_14]|nr:MAG: phosphatidylglycerophosphatase A [Ignavibacteria bacterium RBG_16_34_14]